MKPLMVILVLVLPAMVLAEESAKKAPNWVKIADRSGWQQRDSQGEVVFKDRLWILGGWFNHFLPHPRDVWSSTDGVNWKLVKKTAPFKHTDLSMSLVFDGKMWFMGGWYNGQLPDYSASNEVWSSTDGANWQQATAGAGWSPRIGAGAVVFKNKMWILGGTEESFFGNEKSVKNDVWYSADGKLWKRATAHAPWAPRAFLQAVVLRGKIYVLGGGSYEPKYWVYNDVWSSADGHEWTRVTDAAPWSPRIWFSSVVYRDRMWVLGGWSNHPWKNWADAWYSTDGKQWTQLKSDVIWDSRHEHSAYVFNDKIWIAGGMATRKGLTSEVWSLSIPPGWFAEK